MVKSFWLWYDFHKETKHHKRQDQEGIYRTEADGGISFGDYELAAKAKKSDFEHRGDLYKVKTFKEITKLERNGLFVYESVPGTAVTDLNVFDDGMTFKVEGPEDAQITVEMEAETATWPQISAENFPSA